MEKITNFVHDWAISIVLLMGLAWILFEVSRAPYYDDATNHYYNKNEIHKDDNGNEVVAFMLGEETHFIYHYINPKFCLGAILENKENGIEAIITGILKDKYGNPIKWTIEDAKHQWSIFTTKQMNDIFKLKQ